MDPSSIISTSAIFSFNLPLDSMLELDQSVVRHVKRSSLFYENLQYRHALEVANQKVNKNLVELQQDQIAGRLIQQRMMPPEECNINGLSMHRYMKSSLYLSGDFIDYIRLDEDRVLFYLADVSGHGASSAFLSVLLKKKGLHFNYFGVDININSCNFV